MRTIASGCRVISGGRLDRDDCRSNRSTVMNMIDSSPSKRCVVRKAMPVLLHDALVAEGWCAPAPFATCLMLGVGLTALGAEAVTGARLMGTDCAFWAWVFGASGCARSLALLLERGGGRHAILRLGCGFVGLMAWSQLSWLSLRYAAPASGTMAGGITLYAAVALVELRRIYRAARDARSDGP